MSELPDEQYMQRVHDVSRELSPSQRLVAEPDVESSVPEPPYEPETQVVDPELSADERVTRLERVLVAMVPPVLEQQREADLDRLERQAQAFFDLPPSVAAQATYAGARRAALEAAGVQENADADTVQQGVEIAFSQIQDRELTTQAVEMVLASDLLRGQDMTPVNVGTTVIGAARAIADGAHVRASVQHAAETKRQAQTMSGQSARPATQSDDEAYVARIFEISRQDRELGYR